MKLERHSVRRGRVEIIPMIDTILILLIFYMSFSSFAAKEKRLDTRLPFGTMEGAPEIGLVVHVRNEQEILVNGVGFDPVTFRASLTELQGTLVPVSIVIEADATTTYQAIINVMDACAQAKMTRVAFRPLS